jgi:hypothetical protein
MELKIIILLACLVLIAFMFITAYFYNNMETFENYEENADPFYSSTVRLRDYQDVIAITDSQSIKTT